MLNPQTIERYHEIQTQHHNCDKLGVFFAFSNEQFDEAIERLTKLGKINEKTEIKYVKHGMGLYGTSEGLDAYFTFYEHRKRLVKDDCDPQEVYLYEYDNFESMYAWDGDEEAIKVILSYWGVDTAKKIKRYNDAKTIEQIMKNK